MAKAQEVRTKVSRLRSTNSARRGTGVARKRRFSATRKKIVDPVTTALRIAMTKIRTKNASSAYSVSGGPATPSAATARNERVKKTYSPAITPANRTTKAPMTRSRASRSRRITAAIRSRQRQSAATSLRSGPCPPRALPAPREVQVERLEGPVGQPGRPAQRGQVALLHEDALGQEADPVTHRLGEAEGVGAEQHCAAAPGEAREDLPRGDRALG